MSLAPRPGPGPALDAEGLPNGSRNQASQGIAPLFWTAPDEATKPAGLDVRICLKTHQDCKNREPSSFGSPGAPLLEGSLRGTPPWPCPKGRRDRRSAPESRAVPPPALRRGSEGREGATEESFFQAAAAVASVSPLQA